MTEESYAAKLIRSYEEIIEFQREKIALLEKELKDLRKKSTSVKQEDETNVVKEITDINIGERCALKPPFGSMSSTNKKETLQDYINRGGITELKKTEITPTPIIPTQKSSSKVTKDRRPRIVKRHIFFKSYTDAQKFVNRYSEDFGIGKVKRTVRTSSETKYEIKKNTIDDALFRKGYGHVLIFSMNGLDFGAIEDLEHLEFYKSDAMRCARLFN